jgi:hypothetical protein
MIEKKIYFAREPGSAGERDRAYHREQALDASELERGSSSAQQNFSSVKLSSAQLNENFPNLPLFTKPPRIRSSEMQKANENKKNSRKFC